MNWLFASTLNTPPHSYAEALTLNVTVFGNRAFRR